MCVCFAETPLLGRSWIYRFMMISPQSRFLASMSHSFCWQQLVVLEFLNSDT